MMNRMVNKEFVQEIAAVIRTAQSGDRLPELLKHYHQRDVAKAVTLLTDAERERLFRQLDARTLAEIFPYLDDASRFLAELPADLAAAVGVSRQTINAIEKGEYNPTINLCRSICRVLGKTLDELFWEE